MEQEKKLGLHNVISVAVGLVIATSCLVSLGQGSGTIGVVFIYAMIIACLLNMITVATISELNALMPNTTGGLAQYTLAGLGPFPTLISMVGGYLLCNVLSTGVEASIFAYAIGDVVHLPIPNYTYTLIASAILLTANLKGIDMFAKIQDLVAYLMVGSMIVLGIIGALGLGTGTMVDQPAVMTTGFSHHRLHDGRGLLALHRSGIRHPHFQGGAQRQTQRASGHVHRPGADLRGTVHPGLRLPQLHAVG